MQSLVVLVVLALFVAFGSASPYAGVTKATYNGSMTHYPDTNGYGTTSSRFIFVCFLLAFRFYLFFIKLRSYFILVRLL